jgi:histone H3/H4
MDNNDLMELARRLDETVGEMSRMVAAVATAKQVKEYNGELRKVALARVVAPLLAEHSATAAETIARATPEYRRELEELAVQYATAEKHIARFDVLHAKMEAARSALSLAKEQMKL